MSRSILPPGLVYAEYTSDDCICAGGHFLSPWTMDLTLTTLQAVERRPNLLAHDERILDYMHDVLLWFAKNLVRPRSAKLSHRQAINAAIVLKA